MMKFRYKNIVTVFIKDGNSSSLRQIFNKLGMILINYFKIAFFYIPYILYLKKIILYP